MLTAKRENDLNSIILNIIQIGSRNVRFLFV